MTSQERLDPQAGAAGALQQAHSSPQKRKAEDDLAPEEAKRHGSTATDSELAAVKTQLDEADALTRACCVCFEEAPSVLYVPCKHLATCDACDADQLACRDQSAGCVLCGQVIHARFRNVRVAF